MDTTIQASFNHDLNAATVTPQSFLVSDSTGSIVGGSRSVTGSTAKFTPSAALQTNMTYSVFLSTAIRDTNGTALSTGYSWKFTTYPTSDMTAPRVHGSTPAWNEDFIPVDLPITIVFTEPMDPQTINDYSFSVRTYSGWAKVAGTISYSGVTLVFTPSAPLAFGTTYEIVVTTAATDLGGNPLESQRNITFTTVPASTNQLFHYYREFTIGSDAEAVAIGDINSDGLPDVVVTTSFYFDPQNDHCLFAFLQNKAGLLDPAIKYTTHGDYFYPPESVAIADIDNDGRNDVVLGNSGGSIEVKLQNASGSLLSGVTYSTVNSYKIRTADLNNDGRKDVVGIGYANHEADVLLQTNKGTLASAVTYSVGHGGSDDVDVGDLNSDGLTDVVVMSQNSAAPNISVMPQLGGGTLGAPQGYDVYFSMFGHSLVDGVAVGDINGDGRDDVVTLFAENQPDAAIAVFMQNSGGTLDAPIIYDTYDIPMAAEIVDVNGDGRKDLVLVHDGTDAVGVFLQASDGTLLAEDFYPMGLRTISNPQGLAVADINGDGKNDIAIATGTDLVVLYHR